MQKRSNAVPALPVIYVPHTEKKLPRYPGKGLSPYSLHVFDLTYLHFHDVMEIGLCVKGKGICNVEGTEFPFSAGDVQVIFPYQRHLSKNSEKEPCQWYWLYIDPADLDGYINMAEVQKILRECTGICGIVDSGKYPAVYELTQKLIREMYAPRPERKGRQQYFAACFHMLLMELFQTYGSEALEIRQTLELKEIAPALQRIREDVDVGQLTAVTQLSELCSMSQANFRRKFKSAVGVAAKEYISICMLRKACILLKTTDDKVIEIAQACGFADISGFNRSFLKHIGTTPRAYRKLKDV